jgi:hypothetical protein
MSPTPSRLLAVGLLSSILAAGGCDRQEPVEETPSAAPAATQAATPAAAPAATPPAATCGKKGMPDCPLQAWMKKNVKAPLKDKDTAKLAEALDQIAAHAPEGYADWKEIAMTGAKAARDDDIAAVKQQCKTCHDTHQKRYRKERRTEPLM